MLLLISPAKKLDATPIDILCDTTRPALLQHVETLVQIMKKKNIRDLRSLMGISQELAELNVERYKQFALPFTEEGAKPALMAFKGDVYAHIATAEFSKQDFAYAQQHMRILSGLYGVLRPLDVMHPYRLEMGTKLHTPKGEDLYDFWQDSITNEINTALAAQGDDIVLNLASKEYFKAVKPQKINGRVIEVAFKEKRGDNYKVIGLLAKRARGMCTDYIIRKRVNTIDALKQFNHEGYEHNEALSDDKLITFTRKS